MKKLFAFIAAAAFFCGCVNIEYSGTTAGVRESDAQIAVFTDSARITRSYTVLGTATASGNYQDVSRDRMIEKLRDKAAQCGADAILIVEHQVTADDNAPAANPAFMTAYDYDTTEGNWKQLYEDVDRNFVNTNRNRTSTTAGSSNNFTRIIRAEFIRYNSGK
ncbi:MAG: hypothetical protein E7050_01160 [Lentisphaerae bacterium]|nr:hypothetical protein [Lentisphaerota bacterium]